MDGSDDEPEDELHDRFEALDHEFLKFERIPDADKLHPSQFICACMKCAQLTGEPEKFDIHAEHDIAYLCEISDLEHELTDDAIIYLQRCGVHYDSETECLCAFC